MYLYQELTRRLNSNNPVNVGLIGSGKFGTMFLSQVPSAPGIRVVAVADLNPSKAKLTCNAIGWDGALIERTDFIEDAMLMIENYDLDVVVEATGDPKAGILHALKTIENGVHIVMANVEADVLAGVVLAEQARSAGVVYSMAYGDQPALICEMVEWARSIGFHVISAGKGTKYLPVYHQSNPATVWNHYGLSRDKAREAGMNSKMFNSFLDGTKSALEMAAVSNATGLNAPYNGLKFPPAGMGDLAHILRPYDDGGILEGKGQVEVVSSLERDGRPVFNDLRWGVYIVIKAKNQYVKNCFKDYGMVTDTSGNYSAIWRPYHYIGLELAQSIYSIALENKATGFTKYYNAEVASYAKKNLKPGERLDGEGGYCVRGKLINSKKSKDEKILPLGLTDGAITKKNINKDQAIMLSDVELDLPKQVIDAREYQYNLI